MAMKKNLPATEGQIEKKKWWTKKKIIIVSVIGALLLAAIIGIVAILSTSVFPVRSTKEEAKVVGTVGGYEVKYEEIRFLTLLHRDGLDAELGKYDTLDANGKKQYETLLKERVAEDIKKNYVILSLCNKYGIKTDSISLRNEVNNEMKEYVKTYFDGNMSKYKEWLSENGVTDSVIRFNFKTELLEAQLLDHFVENRIDIAYDESNASEFIDYITGSEDWARSKHVFYPAQHPYTTEEAREAFVSQLAKGALSDEEYTDMKKAWRNELKKQADEYNARGAKSFAEETAKHLSMVSEDEMRYSELKKKIGLAPYVEGFSIDSSVAGIYFTHGQMGEWYEEAAFSLDLYKTSEAISGEDGYYVIMRLPMERADVTKQFDKLLSYYQYAALKKHIDAESKNLSFVGNDYYNSISLIEIE
jgi:hypothetical protein